MILTILVDDHEIIREGLKAILSCDTDIEVVGEAGSLEELFSLLTKIVPDVILLDLSMGKDDDGFVALQKIRELYPSISVIIISMFSHPTVVRKALTLGAKGYIAKNMATSHILQAIHSVASEALYVAPSTIGIVAEEGTPLVYHHRNAQTLTIRESEILQLLGNLYSKKEIANTLHISQSTVSTHIENMKTKLGISTTNELIRLAAREKSL